MKTLTYARTGLQVNLFHDQLLARFPTWKGTRQADGSYSDPLLTVIADTEHIRLTVPDETEESSIQQLINEHDATQERKSDLVSLLTKDDREFARFMEEIVTVLLDKKILVLGDLPARAQARWVKRQNLRQRWSAAV